MTQEIAVDTSILTTDIVDLQEALDRVRRQLTDMFTQVEELDAMWDGPANDEFKRQFANDYENSKELCDVVESIIECMQYAKGQYDLCENNINQIINSINI